MCVWQTQTGVFAEHILLIFSKLHQNLFGKFGVKTYLCNINF